jgi:hypothetical protein
MAASALAQLSYDAAVRSLDLQERAVEQLRARTATLLAASSLVASFFGAQTIQHAGGLGMLSGLAVFWRSNQTEIEGLDRYYVGAAIMLMAQLMLWTVALTATLS